MNIDKSRLRDRILAYREGTISEAEYTQFWDDLTEICAYQIKKSKDDPEYYDFIQDMVMYILDHYLKNFVVLNENGVENSPLAFLLTSSYYSKLVLWNNKYKYERNEFKTLNSSSAEGDGNSTEMLDTWSNEAYSEAWSHVWGKSVRMFDEKKERRSKRKKRGCEEDDKIEEELVEEEPTEEDLEQENQENPDDAVVKNLDSYDGEKEEYILLNETKDEQP